MTWEINPLLAFFCDKEKGYIFEIQNNQILECSVDFVGLMTELYEKHFNYEYFCERLNCSLSEGEEIFELLRKQNIIVEFISDNNKKYQQTMFNVEFAELGRFLTLGSHGKIVFIGFPYDLSVSNRAGTKFASKALREVSNTIYNANYSPSSYIHNLSDLSKKMIDIGDIKGVIFNRNGSEFLFLKNIIFSLLATSNFPIVLGGDHSISFATISGASMNDTIGIIHIDAHDDFFEFDINDWERKMHHGNYLGAFAKDKNVKKIYCIGIRALTPYLADNKKVFIYPEKTIFNKFDIDKNLKYYISFDVDVIDPLIVTGVGTPVPFGFTLEEIKLLLTKLISELEIIGMDFVEYIPDRKEESLTVCALLLSCIIAKVNKEI
ncbi:arginase family protein [Streptococcus parasanguinis]|jgi:putative agmatinase|uniref:arginase family protein n=1 Tax=Streptococcus parasanguinis TaxID=1318 RepID=UPI00352D594A